MSTTTSRTSRAGTVPTRQQLDELDALLERMLALPVQPGGEPAPVIPPPRPAPRPAARAEVPRPVPRAEVPRPAPRVEIPRPAPRVEVPRPVPPPRSYPPSYMVVEDAGLPPETPIPGGRHDLVEGLPGDPVQEQAQARLREIDEPTWSPAEPSWQPSAQTWGPLAETWRQAHPTPASPEIPTDYGPPAGPPSPSVWTQTVVISDAPSSAEVPAAKPAQAAKKPEARTPALLWPLVAFNTCVDLPTWALGPAGAWLRGPSGGALLATAGLLGLVGAAVVAVLDGLGWNW